MFGRLPALPMQCTLERMEPDTFLEQGARILGPKLEPLGYRFAITRRPTKGSGGPFARAVFTRGDREVRLWARFDRLGGVSYCFGRDEFGHRDHMRALGLEQVSRYPGFDDGDPLGGFRRLLHDLEGCDDFLSGDAAAVARKVRSLASEKTGFRALGT